PLLIKNTARTVDHILALHDSLPISGRARAPPALRFPNSPNRTKLPSFPTRRSSELWPGTSAASATASQQSKAHEAPDPNPSRPVDAARTRNIAEDEPQPAPLPGSVIPLDRSHRSRVAIATQVAPRDTSPGHPIADPVAIPPT